MRRWWSRSGAVRTSGGFGSSPRGLSTANRSFPLSDGATLVLTVSTMADPTRTVYGGRLLPDERVVGEATGDPDTDSALLIVPFLATAERDLTLDLDSFPHVVHGHQPGSAYNAHYHARCFHPLVASVDGRYFLGAQLRPGNVHTAHGGLDFVLPILQC